MNKFYTIFTQVGVAKLANATALGTHVELTTMAVGDGNGKLPTPSEKQTALVHEVRRAPLNSIRIDDKNPSWIICEQVIPESIGGWTIREIGLFDKDNDLIAVGNFPETYKPVVSENSGRTQTIRVVLEVSSTETMELKIDPSVVLATREYVDNQIKKATPKQLSATTKDEVDETGHTHALDMASEADAKAGKGNGIVSSSQLADVLGQFGLFGKNEQLVSGFDLNALTATGFYDVDAPKNAPTNVGGWWHIICQRYSNTDQYQIQFARKLDHGDTKTYTRTKFANKWTAWTSLLDANSSNDISGDNYLQFGPNTTWNGALRVGGNGYTVGQSTTIASVSTDSGNLQLSAAKSKYIHMNPQSGKGTVFCDGAGNVVSYIDNKGQFYLGNVSTGTVFPYWNASNMSKAADDDAKDGKGMGVVNATQLKASSDAVLASAKSDASTKAATAQSNAEKSASNALTKHLNAKNPHSQYLLTGDLSSQVAKLFSSKLTSTGYQKMSGGLILQWGRIEPTTHKMATDYGEKQLPIAFPNQAFGAGAWVIPDGIDSGHLDMLAAADVTQTTIHPLSGSTAIGNRKYGIFG